MLSVFLDPELHELHQYQSGVEGRYRRRVDNVQTYDTQRTQGSSFSSHFLIYKTFLNFFLDIIEIFLCFFYDSVMRIGSRNFLLGFFSYDRLLFSQYFASLIFILIIIPICLSI